MATKKKSAEPTRGMNSKGQTVSLPKLTPAKPTEAITAPGQKATGLAKSSKDNRFASEAKTPVKDAGKGFAGSGSSLGTSFKLSQPTKAGNVVNAALAATALPGSGQMTKAIAGKVGGRVAEATTAAFKGLEKSGVGGKVAETMTPFGKTLRSTAIGSPAQAAARMSNLAKNAEQVGVRAGTNIAGQVVRGMNQAGKVVREAQQLVVAKKVSDSTKKKKK